MIRQVMKYVDKKHKKTKYINKKHKKKKLRKINKT